MGLGIAIKTGKGTEHLKAPLTAEAARLMEYPIVKGMFPEPPTVAGDMMNPRTGEPMTWIVKHADGSIKDFLTKEAAEKYAKSQTKELPVHVQDTSGTHVIKTGPGQYETGVAGVYVPEGMGPRERIYLAEGETQGAYPSTQEYPRRINVGIDEYNFNPESGKYEYVWPDVTKPKYTPEELNIKLREKSEKPFVAGSTVQDTLRHEVAHPIYERLMKEVWESNAQDPKANAVGKKINELKQEWQPSEYAKTNPNEWLAETFSKYTHPEFAKHGDMPPRVQEFMKRMVNAAKLSDIDVTGLSVLLKVGGAALAYEVMFGDKETKEKIGQLAGLAALSVGVRKGKEHTTLSKKLKNVITDLTPEEIKNQRLWRHDNTPGSPKINDFSPSLLQEDAHLPHGKFWGENPQDSSISSGWSTTWNRDYTRLFGSEIKNEINNYKSDYGILPEEFSSDFSAGRPAKGSKIAQISEYDFIKLFREGYNKDQLTKELLDMGYTHVRIPSVELSGGVPEIIQLKPKTTKIRGRKELYGLGGLLAQQLLNKKEED